MDFCRNFLYNKSITPKGVLPVKIFDPTNDRLTHQYEDIRWLPHTGLPTQELRARLEALEKDNPDLPRAILKAETFRTILSHGRLAIDPDDIFQEKIDRVDQYMASQIYRWEGEVYRTHLHESVERRKIAHERNAYYGQGDYGHTSPNSRRLLELGFAGLLHRVQEASRRFGLTEEQKIFYASCEICLQAMCDFCRRLASEVKTFDPAAAAVLEQLAVGAPRTTYEAMQLLILYFFLHEYVAGTRVRTLGRLDVLLAPYFQRDQAQGTFSRAQLKEILKFFLNKFWAAKVPFDLPLCIGGVDETGADATNEFSYLFVETYNEMNIYSPKIHVRVHQNTPASFVKLVLDCIRGGNSSFVLVNDEVMIPGLQKIGISEPDARDYVPIGCYEPAVWGKEIGCTGNGYVSLPKAVELVFTDGVDFETGQTITFPSGTIDSYDAFVAAVKAQISAMTRQTLDDVRAIERYYPQIMPDPILSSMYDDSVARGVDVFAGGAAYNNSSMYFRSLATLTDAVAAVKRLVFEEQRLTFEELRAVLKHNWQGAEDLRQLALHLPEKFGNADPTADAIAKEFADFCAGLVNGEPNARGGVFKASSFTIDFFVGMGKTTMATPDGRRHGDIVSKNFCSTVGMDRKGVTGLIRSVTSFDHGQFPNGTVLDVVLHPSAVSGEDGLEAFYAIWKTYANRGGFAMHGNVFRPEQLRAAQKDPDAYKNLQVRVCGWNVYFVNLSKAEQDAFIRQAEVASYLF